MMLKIYSVRLVIRIGVFLHAIKMYIADQSSLIVTNDLSFQNGLKPLHLLWLILALEMISKFFPQNITSIGCRKHFKSNHAPCKKRSTESGIKAWIKAENIAAKKVFTVWFGGNALVAILYFTKVLSESEMVLLSLFYFMGDLICVLFFCPFQSLVMKNRCCVTCRIFNWDSLMFCTPLIFIRSFFSWSLVFIALVLVVWWELAYLKYPQRFFEESNESLKCEHCSEHLCKLKNPTRVVLRKILKERSRERFREV